MQCTSCLAQDLCKFTSTLNCHAYDSAIPKLLFSQTPVFHEYSIFGIFQALNISPAELKVFRTVVVDSLPDDLK